MLIWKPLSFSSSVHSRLVNWQPCSGVKISGLPQWLIASCTASIQKSVARVLETRRSPRFSGIVGDVCRPNVIGASDRLVAQQIWINLVRRMPLSLRYCAWMLMRSIWVDTRRRPSGLPSRLRSQLSVRGPARMLQRQFVDPVHQGSVFCRIRLGRWYALERASSSIWHCWAIGSEVDQGLVALERRYSHSLG